MEKTPYLIFKLNQTSYGINALAVQEIFLLPEIKPIPDTPDEIVGVINLRGQLLVILDLSYRWGSPTSDYHLTDSIIVIEWNQFRVGLLVHQVDELLMISAAEISTELSDFYSEKKSQKSSVCPWIIGIAKLADDFVMLIELKRLISETKIIQNSEVFSEITQDQTILNRSKKNLVFCPNATPEERQLFRERAKNLLQETQTQDFQGLIPLAIAGLNQEYFGILLSIVKEFIEIHNITPIPCTPQHIVGNINLRGEIVTLVDVRSFLNLSTTQKTTFSKAIIVQVDQIISGLIVDEVFDIVYLNSATIHSNPTALRSGQNEYLQGTAPYKQKMMSILDLKKILTQEELIVNEEV
ncbi:chemotaxis protein CheW [Lyngbya sp. PCC 8106]|uniref:chemotaxis protein CheW n=1 Tax=Lyngbya sp. (strain PCC 8106) TaxID=313612 RepID=UPI0000EAC70D|nr:chemotaxis protein CheW [Lyngbya sp. PCC 8106]EAW38780.1 chemotaxis protein CheW [Lyngbya sp. PCC 8106]